MTGTRILRLHMVDVQDSTACPSGTFETAARLDSQAAIIRDSTRPIGVVERDWELHHAGTPTVYPTVTDQPPES